jgi:hypothetical protein
MFDANIGLEAGGIIISPNKSIFFDSSITESEEYQEKFHYNVDTYEDLIGPGKEFLNDEEFFEYLAAKMYIDRSLHKIYCDDDNMIKIFIKYMKLLFPNIDSEAVYTWYTLYFNKIQFHFGHTDTTIAQHKDYWHERIWFEFQQKKPYPRDKFNDMFKKTEFNGETSKLRVKLLERVEFSFIVSTYLSNISKYPGFMNKSLETKIKYMYFRTFDEEIECIKIDVLHGVYNLDKLYPNIKCSYDMKPQEIIKQVPELSFVLDEKMGSAFWYWDNYNNYDLNLLVDTIEDYWTRRSNAFTNVNNPLCPIGLFSLIRRQHTALEILELLADNLFFSEIVLSRHKNIKFNYYFLSYVLDAWKQGNLNVLESYTLDISGELPDS